MPLRIGFFDSPIGMLSVVVDELGVLKRLHFGRLAHAGMVKDNAAVDTVRGQIAEYFAGDRREFTLELAPDGTAFQRAVWDGLRAIPFGRTMSYGALAAKVGRPRAFRAVGAANGANPIALIIPCHRVVGSDGTLTGFGGGIGVKAALLAHEGLLSPDVAVMADRRTRLNRGPILAIQGA